MTTSGSPQSNRGLPPARHLDRRQASKGARHLLAFHQGIGAVKEQDVEVRGIEAPQDGIDRLDDVLVAEIEALRRAGRVVRPAYAHLRLQNHAVAQ